MSERLILGVSANVRMAPRRRWLVFILATLKEDFWNTGSSGRHVAPLAVLIWRRLARSVGKGPSDEASVAVVA